MSLDLPSQDKAPLSTPARRKPSRVLGLALVAGTILLLIILALVLPHSPDSKMAWLTHAELAQATHGGPLTRFKNRALSMMVPLTRLIDGKNYANKKPHIRLSSHILKVSPDAASRFNLGVPASTNSDGMRAWIISPTDLATFQKAVNSNPDISSQNAPTIETVDGMQCQATMGSTVLVAGKFVTVGSNIELIARTTRDSIRLLVGATDTELSKSPASIAQPLITTNFAVACRVIIPDAGALVIETGTNGSSNYWMTISPILVDATGKPIKH